MILLKRILGTLAIGLGLIGLVASVTAIIGIWPASRYLTSQAIQIIESIEPIFTSIGDGLDQVEANLQKARNEIKEVRSAAENVADKGEQSDPADRAKLEATFVKMAQWLEKTEGLMEVLHAGTSTLLNCYEVVTNLPLVWENNASIDPALLKNIQEASQTIEKTSSTLQSIQKQITEIGNNNDVQENALKVAALTVEIDTGLASLENHISQSKQQVEQTRGKLSDLKQSISFWGTAGPVVCTLLLVWLGLSQWSLMVHGWSMLRSGQSN